MPDLVQKMVIDKKGQVENENEKVMKLRHTSVFTKKP